MTRPKGSIHKQPDLNMQLKCLKIKDMLKAHYGLGFFRKFSTEYQLNVNKIYRQLSEGGYSDLSEELIAVARKFAKDKGVPWTI